MPIRLKNMDRKEIIRLVNNLRKPSHPELGSYVALVKVTYFVGSLLLITPVRIVFDQSRSRYVVRRCGVFQLTACILIQCLSTISALRMLKAMWTHLLGNLGQIGAYFDFANGVILHCYAVTVMYFHWFQTQRLDSYVEDLQLNPVVRQCPLTYWKAQLLPIFFWSLTLYMNCIWTYILNQIRFSSYDEFTAVCERTAYELFRVSPRAPGIDLLGSVAILGKFYHSLYIHLPHNVFGPLVLFCAYFLAREFSGFVRNSNPANTTKVLASYAEYKRLLKTLNRVATPYNVHFVAMTLTYHSLHLFDALNARIPLWKLNTYFYIVYLANFLYLPVKSMLMVKQTMKAFLWSAGSYMGIPQQQLSIVLQDFRSDGLAIKGGDYFKISAHFSGKVIQLLIYYSMLNTLALHNIAV